MAKTYDGGIVTAYGAAVRGGYTGTYEQFCAEQAQFGTNAAAVAAAKIAVDSAKSQVDQTVNTFSETTVPNAVSSVQSAGTEQIGLVQNAGTAQTQAVNSAGAAQVSAVQSEGSTQTHNVELTALSAIGQINDAQGDAVAAVEAAETAATDAVTSAQTAAVQAVQAESTTQQAAIQTKGQETIASIPEDYTALSDDVDDLKSAFDTNIAFNAYNVLYNLTGDDRTVSGVTFTWNESAGTVKLYSESAATGTAFSNIFYDNAHFPDGIVAGRKYKLLVRGAVNGAIRIGYLNSSGTIDAVSCTEDTVLTIPAHATGLYIRAQVASGATVDETITYALLNTDTNKELSGKIANLSDSTDELTTGVNDVQSALINYNSVDVLANLPRNSGSFEGVAFSYNADGSCTVTGTATSAAFNNIFSSSNEMPFGIIPGKMYHVKYSAEKVRFRIYPYTNGALGASICDTTSDTVITIPSDATGLIIRLFVGNGTTVSETVKPLLLNALSNEELADSVVLSRTYPLKMAMFGDSILYGRDGDSQSALAIEKNIPYYINRLTPLTVDNFSIGDIGWIKPANNQIAYDVISGVDLSEYDMVLMCYGVNDSSGVIGEWDSTDDTTIMGQINKCIQYIGQQYPNVRMILVPPFNTRSDSFPNYGYDVLRNGWTRRELSDKIKRVADYYHVQFISQEDSPLNAYGMDVFCGADNVHPNPEGYKALGHWFANKIMAYTNDSDGEKQYLSLESGVANVVDSVTDLQNCNCVELSSIMHGENTTTNGIMFIFNGDGTISVTGTATGPAFVNLCLTSNVLPAGIEAGKTYRIKHSSQKVLLRVLAYVNGSYIKICDTLQDTKITIPEGANGLTIRLQVLTGITVNETFAFPVLLTAFSNRELTDIVRGYESEAMLTIIDDDGDVHFMYDLVPLIAELNVPITSAVTPTRIEASEGAEPGTYNTRWMTWNQVQECAKGGAEITCHMYSHPTTEQVEAMSLDEIAHRLYMARNYMKIHGVDSNVLVYSNDTGASSQKLHQAAERVFDCGFAAIADATPVKSDYDRYDLPRYVIDGVNDYNVENMKDIIDDVATNGGWAVWMIHTSSGTGWRNILDGDGNDTGVADTDGTGNYVGKVKSVPALREAMEYALNLGVKIVTAEYGLKKYFAETGRMN